MNLRFLSVLSAAVFVLFSGSSVYAQAGSGNNSVCTTGTGDIQGDTQINTYQSSSEPSLAVMF